MIIEKVETKVRIDIYEDKSGSGVYFDGFLQKTTWNAFQCERK